jgi:hypothetical protein
MEIILQRKIFTDISTIGDIYVNNKFYCYSLEDKVREIPGLPPSVWKIYGKTAIPIGKYITIVTYSNRFKKELPLLLNILGYSGVRFHPGNKPEDTDGCILPGRHKGKDFVYESRLSFNGLFYMIKKALYNKEEVYTIIRGLNNVE